MRALAALAAALAVLAAGCGGGEEIPPLPKGKFIAATRSVTPKVALFAEPLVARVDVMVDRDKYDPERVRVVAAFEPYEREGEVVRSRRDQGRYTHLRYEYTIRCLVYDCLQEVGATRRFRDTADPTAFEPGGYGERKTVRLDAARVVYDDPEKGVQRVRNVPWPVLQSVSRLNFGDTNVAGIGFPFEASVTPVPEASYRISPTLLGAGLIVGALALLAFPAVLVVRSLRREQPVVEVEGPELSHLERALLLVEWASARAEGERREALEVLAVELEAGGAALAGGARRLAWSSRPPSPEAMGELVTAVREADADSA